MNLTYTVQTQMAFILGVTEDGGSVGPHDLPLLIEVMSLKPPQT